MKYSETEVTHIEVIALPDTDIACVFAEGLKIAINEWRNVIIKHKGKHYKVRISDLVATVREEIR